MSNHHRTIITCTGCYIPEKKIPNSNFKENIFFGTDGKPIDLPNSDIIDRFREITGIEERRFISKDQVTSDIAALAALNALSGNSIEIESLDFIIVAHNFGDVTFEGRRSDIVPGIASRVKHKLGVKNPTTLPVDVLFGCPGWLQGFIQAHLYLQSGEFKKGLVIGAETLSRVSDPHDRDSMIYADGAGAIIVESVTADEKIGVLSFASRSDTMENLNLLAMGSSNNPEYNRSEIFLKMDGRKVYQYALETVPMVVKECLEKAGLGLQDVTKILIHQANGKMDEAILKRIFQLYGQPDIPDDIMPMTISWLGNSSVATIPTLLDLMVKGKLNGQKACPGDLLVFASIGAGMNINAMVYRLPQ
ncbi:MAG: ketoacyl-ACP synthase III [Bacteroidetes bacterium]|nr:ketoacyl-ACP synthase III [Bacteroidota bacterium]